MPLFKTPDLCNDIVSGIKVDPNKEPVYSIAVYLYIFRYKVFIVNFLFLLKSVLVPYLLDPVSECKDYLNFAVLKINDLGK